jgi:hypothetical protein
MATKFNELSDESLLAYHESVRRQVAANVQLRGEYRLVSETTRQYATELQKEMELRKLPFVPIDWK